VTIDRSILAKLSEADSRLGQLIASYGPPKIEQDDHLFRSIAESIMAQQLAWAAASTIIRRFKELYPGEEFPEPKDVLATPFEKLRAVGLSKQKASYIVDLATKVADGTINLEKLPSMVDEEVIEHLVQVKGVGRWTAEMILIFSLGRLDVLPVDDYGVQKGFQKVYGLRKLPSPERMKRIAAKWKPYRTIGSWYMWKAVDTAPPVGE